MEQGQREMTLQQLHPGTLIIKCDSQLNGNYKNNFVAQRQNG